MDEKEYQIIGFLPYQTMAETIDGRPCADLGLSVKWATCNVGADHPEEFGKYFAWGEKTEKTTYNWTTYEHCEGTSKTCKDIGADIAGTQYDVVPSDFGNSYVMPSKEQMSELQKNCKWVWSKEGEVSGYKVFGDNGNYIFLPAGGYITTKSNGVGSYGSYYTSTSNANDVKSAYKLYFGINTYKLMTEYKYSACNIRPVLKP